ncbi:hypothetical protein F4818DRAFT_253809 [Hypoxylon cercidicola]|nr:hypothetical protein F4818DRAFT_253809 [Hypoxylon cercidicola]
MKATLVSLAAFLPALTIAGANNSTNNSTNSSTNNSTCHMGISLTCGNFSLADNHTLGATCITAPPRQEIQTTLDLNQCFVNSNGSIIPAPGGGFHSSCPTCTLKSITQTELWCDCFDNSSNKTKGFWQLNDGVVIQNRNGSLTCLVGS